MGDLNQLLADVMCMQMWAILSCVIEAAGMAMLRLKCHHSASVLLYMRSARCTGVNKWCGINFKTCWLMKREKYQ
jgi:hypothetical protein